MKFHFDGHNTNELFSSSVNGDDQKMYRQIEISTNFDIRQIGADISRTHSHT